MAIPFVMPGEEPEDNLDNLIIQLSDIIIQIQTLLRERARRQMMERRNRGKIVCKAIIIRKKVKKFEINRDNLCIQHVVTNLKLK